MKSHPFLDSLVRMRQELTIEYLLPVMEKLGNPEEKYKCIQIAGTNGKGSVAAMISNGLTKCGLYTSPHLHELNERIVVDGKKITDEELNELIERVKPLAIDYKLSFFETLTAAALVYFAEKGCDYAVLEVGLGGRLDATSVVTPVVSVITNIEFDHMHFLGDTIEKIAYEKAGIIKGNIVITSEKKREALKVIEEKSALECATLINAKNQNFDLKLKGDYQQDNAACAYEALRVLGINEEHAKTAVESASWPGRLEQIGNFLFDCAHNESAMRELVHYLQGKEFNLILAMKETKDHEKIVSLIAPFARKIYVTQFTNAPFAFPADKLYTIVKKYNPNCELVQNPEDTLDKSNGFTVVTGSLFLVGELRPI